MFIRSATWIAPQLRGLVALEADPAQEGHNQVNDILLKGARPFTFTEEDKRRFEKDPEFLLNLRRKMECLLCGNVDIFRAGSAKQICTERHLRTGMQVKLEGKDELQKKLIPNFPTGCRRLTPGNIWAPN